MWSSRSRPGEDGLVVEETVVWMVPLREGTKEYKGVLTLEPPNLVFTQRHDGERVELALSDVRRVRRVRWAPRVRWVPRVPWALPAPPVRWGRRVPTVAKVRRGIPATRALRVARATMDSIAGTRMPITGATWPPKM